jgi:HEAT repeat protein
MLPLSFIWLVTEILAVLSIGTMLVLILRRFLAERSELDEAARLRDLRPVLFHCLDQVDALADILRPLGRADRAGLVLLARRLINALIGDSRQVLVELMRQLGHVEAQLDALRNGTVPARLQAASELAWFDQPEVREALRLALRDGFYGVRVTAADSLVSLGSRDCTEEIVRYLTEEVDPLPLSLRPLFRQLANIDPALMTRMSKSENVPVAVLAIDALAAAREGIDYSQLCRIATDHPDKNARAAGLRTLGLLGADPVERQAALPTLSEEAIQLAEQLSDSTRLVVGRAVRRGLADRDWEVRTQAVIAAQRLRLNEAIPRLLAMQSDPQWWVRFRCTQALRALQGPGAAAAMRPPSDGVSGSRVEPVL